MHFIKLLCNEVHGGPKPSFCLRILGVWGTSVPMEKTCSCTVTISSLVIKFMLIQVKDGLTSHAGGAHDIPEQ